MAIMSRFLRRRHGRFSYSPAYSDIHSADSSSTSSVTSFSASSFSDSLKAFGLDFSGALDDFLHNIQLNLDDLLDFFETLSFHEPVMRLPAKVVENDKKSWRRSLGWGIFSFRHRKFLKHYRSRKGSLHAIQDANDPNWYNIHKDLFNPHNGVKDFVKHHVFDVKPYQLAIIFGVGVLSGFFSYKVLRKLFK